MSYNRQEQCFEGYIYFILNDVHPEKIYVGQTTRIPKDRWYGHRAQINDHTSTDKLHNAMEKYGVEHFAMEVIESHKANTKDELKERLNERERYYIEKFDSYCNGYNATEGGQDASEYMQKKVKKYSIDGEYLGVYDSVDSLKTEFDAVNVIYSCCCGVSKYAYGHIWRYEDDELAKYDLPNEAEKREAIKRYKMVYSPIIKYDYRGNIVKEFESAEQVLEEDDITKRKLSKCLSGQNYNHHLFIYRFADEPFDYYRIYKEKQKIVEQRDLDGNFIAVFESAREAGRATGVPHQNIVAVCNHKYKTSFGYKWNYVN